jgi:hypothetical protein
VRATVPQEARPWQLGEKQPLVEGPQALFVGGYLASGANCNSLTSGPLAVQAVALFASVFRTDVSDSSPICQNLRQLGNETVCWMLQV